MIFWEQTARLHGLQVCREKVEMQRRSRVLYRSSMLMGTCLSATLVFSFAAPARSAEIDATAEVQKLEHRFFFKQYASDPVEKRLQRLELLVFGATQGGSNEERAERLRQAISERDRRSAQEMGAIRGKKPSPAAPGPESPGQSGASMQYPILNTLEWRVLKKTHQQESLDQRLSRLESHLFGQASPAMAYADRVERLKRTVGIGVAQSQAPAAPGPVGPLPKARPRAEDPGSERWGYGSPLLPDFMPPGQWQFDVRPDMSPRAAEIFKELDRQMERLMRMPPGNYQWDFRTTPDGGIVPGMPPARTKPRVPELPPYYDPNSI